MIDRRTFLRAGVGMSIGVGSGLVGQRLLGTTIPPRPAKLFGLTADEVHFLHSGLMDQIENEARRLMRIHQARIPQLDSLAQAAGTDIWSHSSSTRPVRWPWKSQYEFHQRLTDAHEHHRRTRPARNKPAVEGVRCVGFRPDEVSFLLCWIQEECDLCSSYEEWDKKLRYYPSHRLIRQSLPQLGIGGWTIIQFSLALCDELGLREFEATALPLTNVRPPLPWKTIGEFYRRRRDVDAYYERKEKASQVSCPRWRRIPLDFSRQEIAFLDTWLQERLRRRPGPAHGEQTAHGAWTRQLMNLVWASDIEIEPREPRAASWPWRSQEELYARLRMAATTLYARPRFRPRPAKAFRPDEDRFMVAWIQETCEGRFENYCEQPRPVLDVIKAHVPGIRDEYWRRVDRPEWRDLRVIRAAWSRAMGLHSLAIAGGPPPEGPIAWPWQDAAEFEARVRDSQNIDRVT